MSEEVEVRETGIGISCSFYRVKCDDPFWSPAIGAKPATIQRAYTQFMRPFLQFDTAMVIFEFRSAYPCSTNHFSS